MKKYYIIMEYEEKGSERHLKTIVNGKETMELPPRLLNWIGRDYLWKLIRRER